MGKKNKNQKESLVNALLMKSGMIIIALALSLSLLWFAFEIYEYYLEKEFVGNIYTNQMKGHIKDQVDRTFIYIENKRKLSFNQHVKTIEEEVKRAHETALEIYNKYKSTRSKREIQNMIKLVLSSIHFHKKRGYIFLRSFNGERILTPQRRQMEGKNIFSLPKNNFERKINEKLMGALKNKDESYYDLKWTKMHKSKELLFERKVFLMRFKPFNWYIGGGDYIKDLNKVVKKEIVERLGTFYFGSNKITYLFLGEYKNKSSIENISGERVWGLKDDKNRLLSRIFIEASLKNKKGSFIFITPKFPNKERNLKLVYVRYYKKWNWVIGAGIYMDDINEYIEERRADIPKRMLTRIPVLLFISFAAFWFLKRIFNKILQNVQSSLQDFEQTYLKKHQGNLKLNPEDMNYLEFEKLACTANKILDEKEQAKELMVQSEKMFSLGNLSAGLAHEINNPLGIILQSIQNVKRRMSSDLKKNRETAKELGIDLEKVEQYFEIRKIKDYLMNIQSAGERAAEIISTMLDFSRPSQNRVTGANIVELIENAIVLVRNDYSLKNVYDFKSIDLEFKLIDKLPLISCRPSELEQVFLNLFKNAAEAFSEIKEADFKPKIEIKVWIENSMLVIEINDNGPGMDEDVRKRVFDPFYTTKSPDRGTGLGLAVCYFIISRNHKGQFYLESEKGKGSTFRILLPI